MKKYLSFISAFILTSGLLSFQFNNASTVADVEDEGILQLLSNADNIDHELAQLEVLEQKIYSESLNYDQLTQTNGKDIVDLNLSEEAASNVLAGSSDAPLGIPGFFWGFCLGFIGLLIVYLVMDGSPDRREQVNNALWGCVAAVAVSVLLQVALSIGLWAST